MSLAGGGWNTHSHTQTYTQVFAQQESCSCDECNSRCALFYLGVQCSSHCPLYSTTTNLSSNVPHTQEVQTCHWSAHYRWEWLKETNFYLPMTTHTAFHVYMYTYSGEQASEERLSTSFRRPPPQTELQ